MLKLTATGFVAAAATGVMLLGGPAHADRLFTNRTAVPAAYAADGCYDALGNYQPSWCGVYPPTTYYPCHRRRPHDGGRVLPVAFRGAVEGTDGDGGEDARQLVGLTQESRSSGEPQGSGEVGLGFEA